MDWWCRRVVWCVCLDRVYRRQIVATNNAICYCCERTTAAAVAYYCNYNRQFTSLALAFVSSDHTHHLSFSTAVIRRSPANFLMAGHVLRGWLSPSFSLGGKDGRDEKARRYGSAMPDWMKSNDEEYEHIKNRARNRQEWRHWRPGPAFE